MIIFKKIRYKNLLSTGNTFTEIELDSVRKTLLMGFTGSGKSSSIDAITFALYGKPFRKITKSGMLNSINKSELVTEIEFLIGSNYYKVIRGIKPNIFEIYCNDVLVQQDAKIKDYQDYLERYILKINYKSFTQVVILGSARYTPFMQLSASDRRSVIEDLLDIQIFSNMNVIVKDKLTELKESIQDCKRDIELYKDKIELYKQNIKKYEKSSEEIILKKEASISNTITEIESVENEIKTKLELISKLSEEIVDKGSLETKYEKLVLLKERVRNSIDKFKKEVVFYNLNDNCPTCKQHIEIDFKSGKVNFNNNKIEELSVGNIKLDAELKSIKSKLAEISTISKEISSLNSDVIRCNSTISSAQKYIKLINEELKEIESEKKRFNNDEMENSRNELDKLVEKYEEYVTDKSYYDFVSLMLKDGGIKTKIIKQYLPILNKYINQYLSQLDFFVNFNITENFEEVIKSRHRDEFTYANFSEGEKMRLDLAVLFSFRQLARLKNSVNTNLLILDEVMDSSLDLAGTDAFMELISNTDKYTNVFVISHKTDQILDKFDRVINFNKVKNFSKMKVI